MIQAYQAYQRQNQVDVPRIELLLSLYDGAIARLEQALELLKKNEAAAAAKLATRVQVIVSALASGVDLSYGELPQNILRLYEFVVHNLGAGGARNVTAALEVLRPLREGLEGIRAEALQLERSGAIPPVESQGSFLATA